MQAYLLLCYPAAPYPSLAVLGLPGSAEVPVLDAVVWHGLHLHALRLLQLLDVAHHVVQRLAALDLQQQTPNKRPARV